MRTKALSVFVFALLLVISGCRQPKPSVFGVEFGSSYHRTWQILSEWFEAENMHEVERSIFVDDVSLGNLKFDYAVFFFQYGNNRSYLHKVVFFAGFEEESDKASIFEGQLIQMHKEIYRDLTLCGNKDGERRYKFGTNPKDENEPLGVITRRGNSILLIYGPIYYLPKSSDF